MQEHQQALSCFFLEFWPSLERAPISEDQSLIDALVLDPEVGPFPWCAELVENTRICHFRSNWGWQLIDTVLPLLPKLTKPEDLWIQNMGVWYNDPDSLRSDMNRFGQYYADHKSELPTMIWRQSSVQHFPLSPTGDFGGFWLPPHYPCKPIGGEMDSIALDPITGELLTDRPDLQIVQRVSFTWPYADMLLQAWIFSSHHAPPPPLAGIFGIDDDILIQQPAVACLSLWTSLMPVNIKPAYLVGAS